MVRWLTYLIFVWCTSAVASSESTSFEVGVAARDITPSVPVDVMLWRMDKVAAPLFAKAVAFKDRSGASVVLVSVDTMGMARDFAQPLIKEVSQRLALEPGHLILISTHAHITPNISTYWGGTVAPGYPEWLRQKIAEVVSAALSDLKPAELAYAVGRATFAMNRRGFTPQGRVDMLPNPDGPVDWDVPVLKIKGEDGSVRAILFGYACHAVAGEAEAGLSPDYPGYAARELETAYPGSVAIYLTGFGGDQNPYPRNGESGTASEPWSHADREQKVAQPYARRHGLELAGAVAGVMDRPMQAIKGSLKLAYQEVNLRLTAPPSRQKIEADARYPSRAVKEFERTRPNPPADASHAAADEAAAEARMTARAEKYLSILKTQGQLPQSASMPLAALRLGNLTMLFMGGEPVVDYALRFKRLLGSERT